MNDDKLLSVESRDVSDFIKVMNSGASPLPCPDNIGQVKPKKKLNLDPENVKKGLGQLVLTLIKLLHELLEKQAIRRIDGGSLTDDEIEKIGYTLMRQSEEIENLCKEFGLENEDLNLDLGPLGKLL
jgi:hypothetical protein